jgi:protease IV
MEWHNTQPQAAQPEAKWERYVIEKLAYGALKEQRAARRWGIFFKVLTFLYLTFLLLMVIDFRGLLMPGKASGGTKHTAVIDLQGAIGPGSEASAEKLMDALNAAFKDENTAGIVLRANSPGGSPVQSGMVYDEIKRLRAKYPEKPIHSVVEEMCASGCYYIVAATDKIYANQASIVGSIGVLMNGFGFTGTMDKLGVERRLLTAGENKAILDPFSPPSDKHKAFAQDMLNDIHQQFIKAVKGGRGKRLKETPDMFSGLFWTGTKSMEMGLVDQMGSVDYVAKEVFKAEDKVDFSSKDGLADRLAKRFGASMGQVLADRIVPQAVGGFGGLK